MSESHRGEFLLKFELGLKLVCSCVLFLPSTRWKKVVDFGKPLLQSLWGIFEFAANHAAANFGWGNRLKNACLKNLLGRTAAVNIFKTVGDRPFKESIG